MCFSFTIMSALLVSKEHYRPLNRWDNARLQPGPVHSVGDSITGIRLKHSHPDLPLRWEKAYSGKNSTLMGDNNTDGDHHGFFNDGYGQPYVKDSNWAAHREFKTPLGWVQHDLRPADKSHEPLLSSTPNAKWDLRVADTYSIYRPGFEFLPLPGGYTPVPGELPRGGLAPEITAVTSPENDQIETPEHLGELSSTVDFQGGSSENTPRLFGRILPRPGRRFFKEAAFRLGPKKR